MSTICFYSKKHRFQRRFFYLILCTALVCPMLLFTGCQNAADTDTAAGKEPISISSIKLNTAVQITIYDSQDKSLLDDCLALCDNMSWSSAGLMRRVNFISWITEYQIPLYQTKPPKLSPLPIRSMAPPTPGTYPKILRHYYLKAFLSLRNLTALLTLPLPLWPLSGISRQKIQKCRMMQISKMPFRYAAPTASPLTVRISSFPLMTFSSM